MKKTFKIRGLDCASCALQLKNEIEKIEGIETVVINFMTERMIIELSEENKDEIIKKLKKTIKKEEPDVIIYET